MAHQFLLDKLEQELATVNYYFNPRILHLLDALRAMPDFKQRTISELRLA